MLPDWFQQGRMGVVETARIREFGEERPLLRFEAMMPDSFLPIPPLLIGEAAGTWFYETNEGYRRVVGLPLSPALTEDDVIDAVQDVVRHVAA